MPFFRVLKFVAQYVESELAVGAAVTAVVVFGMVQQAQALPLTTYAESSKLSSGSWVRVGVTSTGIYLVPEATLRSWGFADPSKVKVYGYGARRLPELLSASTYLDDLPQTASEWVGGRGVVFYGEGPVSSTQTSSGFMRPVQNPFTTVGYYYLSDCDEERLTPDVSGRAASGESVATYQAFVYHEEELVSPGYAGHLLLGEDFKYTPSQTFTFQLPDIVDSRPVRMEASFVAKSRLGSSTVQYTANGKSLPKTTSDDMARVTDAYTHGVEAVSRKEFTISGSTLNIGVNFKSTSTVMAANLNYIGVTYTRQLRMPASGQFGFAMSLRNQYARLSGTTDATRIWDVTDPTRIGLISSRNSGGTISWSSDFAGERTYMAWNTDAALPAPMFVDWVGNQDLHATIGEADMVIFTLPEWKSQAERLAQFHESSSDALKVAVLTPQAVYNEFSSGAPDVQAFRKLLKMLYDRNAASDHPLRYALFMSRPTFDNRRLTQVGQGLGYPTMPCWFTDRGLNDNDSYTTDDVLGFLEDNSGSNLAKDRLSIAVGRLTITSANDAKGAVDKIIKYSTNLPKGNWRNNVLIVADDQDYAVHMKQADTMWLNMTNSAGGADAFYKKIYTDQYELISNVYVDARTAFYRALDEGVMWWSYCGHANPASLTGEGLVTYSDLNNLYLRYWPVVYAATCDFMRWDSPSISGAEILFKNANGGVISAISATRPVYIADNGYLSAAIGNYVLDRDENGLLLTVGEVYRQAKNNYKFNGELTANANKLRYVLLGDPALRRVMPSPRVVIDEINGTAVPVADDEEPPVLMARQQLTMTGHIESPTGEMQTDFNGILTSTLYDAEESITTRGNGDTGEKFTFDQQGGRLFVGNDSIRNGRFTIKISMPSEVVNNYRPAAINMYAYASDGAEAVGVNRDFYVYGTDLNAEPDNEAPRIEAIYLNHPSFKSGDAVNHSPMLIAQVSDNRAINMSTAGIGHQMTLLLDGGTKSFTDVADYYVPYSDGTPGGVITYPMEDLAEGYHSLRLRVWDTAPNSAEATIEFFVARQITPNIYNVYTDVNPASTEVNFYVSHDRPDRTIDVTIEVFDMMGRRMWQASQSGRSDMFESMPLTWDLLDAGGRRVPRGIYLYRATISDEDSGEKTATASRRLAVTAQ